MGYFVSEVWGFAMLGDFGVWRCVIWHSISAGGTGYPLNSMSWTSCSMAKQIFIRCKALARKVGEAPGRRPPSAITTPHMYC